MPVLCYYILPPWKTRTSCLQFPFRAPPTCKQCLAAINSAFTSVFSFLSVPWLRLLSFLTWTIRALFYPAKNKKIKRDLFLPQLLHCHCQHRPLCLPYSHSPCRHVALFPLVSSSSSLPATCQHILMLCGPTLHQ